MGAQELTRVENRSRHRDKSHEAASVMTEAALEAGAGEAWLLSWLGAVLGTALVGVSGLVPMLIIPLDAGPSLRSSAANRLIGDVVQSRRRPLLGPSPG